MAKSIRLKDIIDLHRVKVHEETNDYVKVKYGDTLYEFIKNDETSFQSNPHIDSISPALSLRLETRLGQRLTLPEMTFSLDNDAPELSKELMIFHELREKEYDDAGFEDAHNRAVNDEVLYLMKFFDKANATKYLNWQHKYRVIAELDNISTEDVKDKAIKPTKVEKWDGRFTIEQINYFQDKGIKITKAKKYDKRFSNEEIIALISKKVSGNSANQFDYRYNLENIIYLTKEHITGELANKYAELLNCNHPRLKASDIAELIKNNIDLDTARLMTSKDFTMQELKKIIDKKIDPKILLDYRIDHRFYKAGSTYRDIIKLYNANIFPEEANKYPGDFEAEHIIRCKKLNIIPDAVKGYPDSPRFTPYGLIRLAKIGYNPDKVKLYQGFHDFQIIKLAENGIGPEMANEYSSRRINSVKKIIEAVKSSNKDI